MVAVARKPKPSPEDVAATKMTAAIKPTLGSQIDALNALRETKRELDAKIKEVETQYEAAQLAVLEALEAQGTDKATGKTATASISVSVVGNIDDRDMLNAFMKKTGNFQLLQNRISLPAMRELLEKKGAIPGVAVFHKKTLNLRAL